MGENSERMEIEIPDYEELKDEMCLFLKSTSDTNFSKLASTKKEYDHIFEVLSNLKRIRRSETKKREAGSQAERGSY